MEKKGIIKIAVVGPESTGKSWLSEKLAKTYQTVFVPEYARMYFEEHDIENYTIDELDVIYKQQLINEQNLLEKANRLLISDTTALTGKIWSEVVFKTVSPYILNSQAQLNYDLYLLCDIDLPWVKDAQRKNELDREQILAMHIQELENSKATFELIRGTEEERLVNAVDVIERFLKSIA